MARIETAPDWRIPSLLTRVSKGWSEEMRRHEVEISSTG